MRFDNEEFNKQLIEFDDIIRTNNLSDAECINVYIEYY